MIVHPWAIILAVALGGAFFTCVGYGWAVWDHWRNERGERWWR